MGEHDAFGGILASLHDAMLDDARWPATSVLIDEACGLTGNGLIVREGPLEDVRVLFVGAYRRGQRREDQERDYLENYYPADERVPRYRQLPDSRLVHFRDLLTADVLKTLSTYNDMLLRTAGPASRQPCGNRCSSPSFPPRDEGRVWDFHFPSYRRGARRFADRSPPGWWRDHTGGSPSAPLDGAARSLSPRLSVSVRPGCGAGRRIRRWARTCSHPGGR